MVKDKFKIKGELTTLSNIARDSNVKYGMLRDRLVTKNMSVDEAIANIKSKQSI